MNMNLINADKFIFPRRIAFFAFVLFVLSAFGASAIFAQGKGKTARKKSVEPRTVVDFYLRLPVKYFPYIEYEPKNRASLMGSHSASKALLSFDNNRPIQPVNAQILLLKRMSGVSMLAISYTDCDSDPCKDSLRFVEYEKGRWTEVDAAPPLERGKIVEIYRRKTGKNPGQKAFVIYDVWDDKSIIVRMGDTEIYKLEWDGNIYDFTAPNE